MEKKTAAEKLDLICKKYDISDKAKAELLQLIKDNYIQGSHDCWEILTQKK